jgi:hypothetical protein
MPNDRTLTLNPWPFDQSQIVLQVPARQVQITPFQSPDDFQAAYQSAPFHMLEVAVHKP